MPMEVDVLSLDDGSESLVIGREDQIVALYEEADGTSETVKKGEKRLSECSISEIRASNRVKEFDDILTLEEFLSLVKGEVPVILELKVDHSKEMDLQKKERLVSRAMKTVSSYLNLYGQTFSARSHSQSYGIAIHSADFEVVELIKKKDCMIPCGLISTDFSRKTGMNPEFVKKHADLDLLKKLDIDFISYDISCLENGIARRLKEELQIPLLGWAVKNRADQRKAQDFQCDNFMIEDSTSYL